MEEIRSPKIVLKSREQLEEEYKQEEEQCETKPKLTRNEYMRNYMRKRAAKEREEKAKTQEIFTNIVDTFINIVNSNPRAFTKEQLLRIEDICDTKRYNIRDIANLLNEEIKGMF